VRRLGTWLTLGLAVAGPYAGACNGPISDWPPKAGSDSQTGGPNPATNPPPVAGAGGTASGAPGGMGSPGGTGVNTPPATSDSGTVGIPGTAGGGLMGGASGSPDASAPSLDAGAPSADAGLPTAEPGDAGVPLPDAAVDAGDSAVPDGGCNLAPDAGSIGLSDGGVSTLCTGFGCGVTLDSLNASTRPGGACAATEALAQACSGELSRAAIQCTQENALSLSVGRAVTSCMRRLPKLSRVPGDCLECYADETLCTLTRCFVACIDGSDPACDTCRRQSCREPFVKCSGLP
jgi:hypothetical protein